MNLTSLVFTATTWIVPILLAITFHEAAHAYSAWRLGDPTAFKLGRVTFNPIRHVDPFGTVIVPGLLLLTGAPFLFGWAKPVPVMPGRLRNPRRDMALVALAGPLMNVALAVVSALLLQAVPFFPATAAPWLVQTLYQSVLLNLVLAVFNMLPLPPLDGSRIVASLLPVGLARHYARLDRFGFLLLIAIIFLIPMLGRQIGVDLNVLRWLVGAPLAWLMPLFLSLGGAG